MLGRLRLLLAIGGGLRSIPDRAAHGLVVRELDTWIRLEFLGVMARSGIADALRTPATVGSVARATGITDHDLLGALLDLGVSLRELRERRGRYTIRGRRMRAITGDSHDLRGLVEELIVYDNRVYSALTSHLHGEPPGDYDAHYGDVIANASRLAEPILGPAMRTVAADLQPSTVLDIGCGSGIYLRHVLDTVPAATGVGIDVDPAAAAAAEENLADLRGEGRCTIERGDIEAMPVGLGPFDLVLLLNNIYYWSPEDRPRILRTIGDSLAPAGTVVVATATPSGPSFNRHLDLALRVTESSHRLPTPEELWNDLTRAGFEDVSVTRPVPGSGLAIATARGAGAHAC